MASTRLRRSQSGSTSIEFVLVTLILLTILGAVVEFGRTFSELEVYTGAAREGARYAAVGKNTSEIAARVGEASDPYSPSEAPTITVEGGSGAAFPCDDRVGSSVTVGWTQTLELDIFGLPVMNPTAEIKGVFRCE